MHNSYIAILAAALAAWVFGAVWYTLLGKTWMAASGISAEEIERRRKTRKMPLAPMAVSFVCEIVMAVLLSLLLATLGVGDLIGGALVGLVLGIGFVATSVLVNNLFQGRKLMLSLIDSAHWIIVLAIEGLVLVALS
jgi:ABC-type Co2+ transport system permease subunit